MGRNERVEKDTSSLIMRPWRSSLRLHNVDDFCFHAAEPAVDDATFSTIASL